MRGMGEPIPYGDGGKGQIRYVYYGGKTMDNEKKLSESEELELLREIQKKVNLIEKRQKRQIIIRIVVWVLVIAALVAAYFYVRPMILQIRDTYYTVLEEVDKVEKLIDSIDLDTIAKNVNELTKVNVRTLIDSTEKARAMIDTFSELNYEGLVDSVKQLGEVIQPLLDLFGTK